MKLSERDLWNALIDTQAASGTFFHAVIGGDSYRINVEMLRAFGSTTGKYTAYNGGGQANATSLTAYDCLVNTATQDNDSVKIPAALVNRRIKIRNTSGFSINIYPQTGENFTGEAANAPIPLADGNTIEFACFTDGEWHI